MSENIIEPNGSKAYIVISLLLIIYRCQIPAISTTVLTSPLIDRNLLEYDNKFRNHRYQDNFSSIPIILYTVKSPNFLYLYDFYEYCLKVFRSSEMQNSIIFLFGAIEFLQ